MSQKEAVLAHLLGYCQRRLPVSTIPPQGQKAIDFLAALDAPTDGSAAIQSKEKS